MRLFTCINRDEILEIIPAVSSFRDYSRRMFFDSLSKSFCSRDFRKASNLVCVPQLLAVVSHPPPALSCLAFLPPSASYNTTGHCPRAEPCAIFLRGVHFVSAAPFLHHRSLLLSPCALCLLPHLPLPVNRRPRSLHAPTCLWLFNAPSPSSFTQPLPQPN